MFRTYALMLATVIAGVACQETTSVSPPQVMRLVTASHDEQTQVVPSGPQHVAIGQRQTFAVSAASGFGLTTLVGGSCPGGDWTQNIYKTGPILRDCTVIFSAVQSNFDVSTSTSHVTTVPSGEVTVASGAPQAFVVTADPGYALGAGVTGTCAGGSWSGNTYTTGPINANCDIGFSAAPVYFLVTPADGNVSTAPVAAQPVLWGSTQAFTVVANSGFTLSNQVAGTCSAGSWSGNVYTTGAVNGNCTVVFDAFVTTGNVIATGTDVSITPSVPQPVALGGSASLTVNPNAGYSVNNAVGGTCPAGSWSGNVYTTGAVTGGCSVSFSATVISPNVTRPALTTLSVQPTGGNTTFTLGWQAPLDAGTPAGNQNYTLCVSNADPGYHSFASIAQVLNGNACVNRIGTTSASIAVQPGHAYYFNLVVSNVTGQRAVYQAKGEFADLSQLNYMPFEGNANDVVAGLHLVDANYQGTQAAGGSEGTDRFGNANSSRALVGAQHDCLMTNAYVDPLVAGTNPRTITFWLKSGVNGTTGVPLGIGGNGNNIASGDHFGIYFVPGGSPQWLGWYFGDDLNSNTAYADNSPWQFWAISYTSVGTVGAIYLNGVALATQGTWHTATPNTQVSPLYVGCGVDDMPGVPGILNRWFTGSIDDIRVFDRVLCDGTGVNGCALMTNEMTNLYNVTRP